MQTITSKNTSVNKNHVPALFRVPKWLSGTTNLDLGGGRYDTATRFLTGFGVENIIVDEYNRSFRHNNLMMARLLLNKADSCTIANVLNVINSERARIELLRTAADLTKDGATTWIWIYCGDESGVGKKTKSGWQANRLASGFESEVREVFPDVVVKNKHLIIARNK